jgi:uncharacterized protein (TIGR00255 family)
MSAPIRSMTGYARVRKSSAHGEITVGLKSVNHRGLDLHFHLEPALNPFEAAMRAAAKRSIVRGHIDIHCSVASTSDGAGGVLNMAFLQAYLAAFRRAAAEQGLNSQPDLNQAFRIPGMFGAPQEAELDSTLESPLLAALEEAIEMLNKGREREGVELARFIREQNRIIQQGCQDMEHIRRLAIPAFQTRLREKLRDLLGASGFDPQRLVQEAALLAERGDISEEVSRLRIHSQQLEEILDAGGEAGKKLDFLLQEMNRETNTILSKTSGIGDLGLRITELALESKGAIEKIREQALNLE